MIGQCEQWSAAVETDSNFSYYRRDDIQRRAKN